MKTPLKTNKISIDKLYFTVVTAGHVDHGKTSLIESLTNTNPDRLIEEQLRSMTIDLGYAHYSTKVTYKNFVKDLIIGFVDVPGHDRFLRNMLCGVSCQNTALLVVAANESIKPQTIQHVKILNLLGYKNILTVITKADLVDSQTIAKVKLATENLLKENNLNSNNIIVFSIYDLTTINNLKKALETYAQELLDNLFTSPEFNAPMAYMPIDRIFNKVGLGTIITGSLIQGLIDYTQTIYIEPGNLIAKIKSLQSFNENVSYGYTGARLALNLNLKQGKEKDIKRGSVLSNQKLASTDSLIIYLTTAPNSKYEKLKSVSDITLYHNCAERQGKCFKYKTADKLITKIRLTENIVAFPGDRCIVKFKTDDIYGGIIISTNDFIDFKLISMQKLASLIMKNDFHGTILLMLEQVLFMPLSNLDFFIPANHLNDTITNLNTDDQLKIIDDVIILASEYENILKKLIKLIEYNTNQSIVNKTSIANYLDNNIFKNINVNTQNLVNSFINDLLAKNLIEIFYDNIRLKFSDKDLSLSDLAKQILEILSQYKCIEIKFIAKELNIESSLIKRTLKDMEIAGHIFIIDYDYVCLSSVIANAQTVLLMLWDKNKNITPKDFKESLNITRKYALALLRFFDDRQITRLDDKGRKLVPNRLINFTQV